MKLELKHLAGYLPYDLRYKFANQTYIFRNVIDFDYEYSKPILHPLSDLTKEIEVNGEKFVPIEWLNKNKSVDLIEVQDLSKKKSIFNGRTTNIRFFEYCVIEKLLEWHFDIHGLIENNLAIDINTLKL